MSTPLLQGEALGAVEHRGSHLQIIASAGSGKTEVVSQRVVSLLAEGVPSRGIVAFTFTEKAAAELKERITVRVEERLGPDAVDQLGGLFVGTIHAYCFRLLQQFVPRYETYDVLDENQLNAFIAREASQLAIKDLTGKLYSSIHQFLMGLEVIENELIDDDVLPDPFVSIYREYLIRLERYRLLTFGQQVVRAVRELEWPAVRDLVHSELRHLIVDEYQDVNPAQERLIELLAGPEVELCVVGDDDQAIYGWRGSDVSNIREFAERYEDVATFSITQNRRSVPGVVELADEFADTIPDRLEKTMTAWREPGVGGPPVVAWSSLLETDEAGDLASLVIRLHEDHGVPYGDIAVLVRGRIAYQPVLDHFASFDIPVQPGGRTGLFVQPDARLLGRTVCWLTDLEWREDYENGESVELSDLLADYGSLFDVTGGGRAVLKDFLERWKTAVPQEKRRADLLHEYYDLLDVLRVRDWDLLDLVKANRLGTLARFSALLADYESVRGRARVDDENPGEQVGAWDRGTWYYRNLGLHILNYAQGGYEDFDGEPDVALDAVEVSTIHRAKGLEWPVVFVPSLTRYRFPSTKTGSKKPWPIPRHLWNAARYEGSDAEERRLFYVAMTRSRDFLSLSRHRAKKKAMAASPYWQQLASDLGPVEPDDIEFPEITARANPPGSDLQITFSEIASFLDCGLAYRLRTLLGFQPRLAPELGYGKAVHHVMRMVAEQTKERGTVPSVLEIEGLLDRNFFLPAANKAAHRQLKAAARRLVTSYATDHADDLFRIWETERPFELHLEGVTVSGRADVILDKEGGVETALAIVDYKTSTSLDQDHALQIQVYADAGRREGLDVRGAYVHDLRASALQDPDARKPVPTGPADITAAEVQVLGAAERIKSKDFTPSPGKRCRRCEVRTVCPSAKL
jgi:DNA helicase-2/ATP-dependent DNA helicase PcrA